MNLTLRGWLYSISLACIFGLGHDSAAAQIPTNSEHKRAHVLLYRLKADATPAQKNALRSVLNRHQFEAGRRFHGRIKTPKQINATGIILEAATLDQTEISAKEVREIVAPTATLSEEQLADQLKQTGAVEFAEPDYTVPPALVPNDEDYSYEWWASYINLPAAWDISTGSPNTVIAICDSGIEATHPDLQPNLRLPGYNSVDGSANTAPIFPHGTVVSGVAVAAGNNGVIIAGTNWKSGLLPVRVTNSSNGSAQCSDIFTGIEWAADHSAKVINLSFEVMPNCPNTINAAGQYAWDRGALLVVASGNSTTDISPYCPSTKYFALVGAVTRFNTIAGFSSYGSCLDLTAPGAGVITTSVGGGAGTVDGTSIAAPIVAGVAGLIYSLNPSFTPAQVLNFMTTTAQDLGASGRDNTFGYGVVNAGAAVQAAAQAIGTTSNFQGISGQYVDQNGNSFGSAPGVTVLEKSYLNNAYFPSSPFNIPVSPAGNYDLVTSVPLGYTSAYSICTGCTNHPAASYVSENALHVSVPANSFVDVDWKFTPAPSLGLNYVKMADPPPNNFTYAYAPAVVQQNGVTHVFFCSDGQIGKGVDFIRYTRSNDGVNWTAPTVMLQSNAAGGTTGGDQAACDPSVVYYQGPSDGQPYYYMYYSSVYNPGVNQTDVQVARSANIDGPYLTYTQRATWESNPPDPQIIVRPKAPRTSGNPGYGAGQQAVVAHNGKLYMWYNDDTLAGVANFQTYFMTSANPVQWDYMNSAPITLPGLASGSFGGNHSPDVRFDPISNLFVLASIPNQASPGSNYLATSTSPDGLSWTAYSTAIDTNHFPQFAGNVGFTGDVSGNMPAGVSLVSFGGPYDIHKTGCQTGDTFCYSGYQLLGVQADLHPSSVSSNAQFSAQTLMQGGASAIFNTSALLVPGGGATQATITMVNNGNTTWSASGGFMLDFQTPANDAAWGISGVAPVGSVSPGNSGVFTFNLNVPATPGIYPLQWQMRQNGTAFGASTLALTYITPPVAVTPASGSSVAPGATTFQWQAVPGAISYQFNLHDNTANSSITPLSVPNTTTSATLLLGHSYTWWVQAFDAVGHQSGQTFIPFTASGQGPTVTFNGNPLTITAGQSTTLSWTTSNAVSVSINNGVGPVALNGSVAVSPSVTTTYTLTATGSGSTTTTQQVTITVNAAGAPTVTLTATPMTINSGQLTTLFWTTTNATTVSFDHGIGQVPANGSADVGPTATITYTLTATGPEGIASKQVTITVNSSAPTATFIASPLTIAAGQSTTLSWTTTNATSVSIDNGVGAVGLNSSVAVSPSANTTYTLTVTGPSGTLTPAPQVTITVNQRPTITQLPGDTTVLVGNSAIFQVGVSGTPPFTYQWYKNGAAIGLATQSSYTTPATTLSDNNAQFSVVINNVTNLPATGGPAILHVNANTVVATPSISPNGGVFSGSVQVTLTCATVGAAIYYTTDGSVPSQSATLYSAPFTLTTNTLVRAVAFKTASPNSSEAQATFTANQPPVARVLTTPTPATGAAPFLVSFDGSTSQDSDGTIVAYDWDFGDGSAHGSGATTSHTYGLGTFTAKLTVTDNNNALSTPTSLSQVTINSAVGTPTITLTKISNGVFTAHSGDTITYTIQYRNTGTGSAVNPVITDAIPSGTSYVFGSVSGSGSFDGSAVHWTLSTLAPNASGSVSFSVKVN